MKNNFSTDYLIYLNHVNNTGGTPYEKWEKVQNSIIEPMVLIPLVIGCLAAPFVLLAQNEYVKTLLIAVSSIGIGIGVNYFIFYFNKQTEYQTLKYKAETTVRSLNLAIKSLLRKSNIDNEDKNTIDLLTSTIDFWKDYYPNMDSSKMVILKKLKEEIKDEKIDEARLEKLTLFTKIEA